MNSQSGAEKFFTVALRTQTYSNLLYLLLSFPLGIFYFVFLVTGISLGIGTIIIWVGLLILGLVIAGWLALGAFERQMAVGMLGEKIDPFLRIDLTGKTLWQKFTSMLGSPVTWKSLVYLLLKFPLGILNFVVLVTALSVSLAFAAMPLYYRWFTPEININGVQGWGVWFVDTPVEAAVFCLIGLLLLFVSLHVLNGLAWANGAFARLMLGDTAPAAIPAAPGTAEVVTPARAEPPAAPAGSEDPSI